MNLDERDAVAARFGVSNQQVERDHLISFLLAAIAAQVGDRVHLIGGTALARTHLPLGRLSEDIDLVALGGRSDVAAALDAYLPRAVARSHGRLRWDPPLSDVRDTEAGFLRTTAGLGVRVQLLSSRERAIWPAEVRKLEQRYRDAPAVRFRVPTLVAFAAAKTVTWNDRRAPRDLWDLWALAGINAINEDSGVLYRRLGPTNRLPASGLFDTPPKQRDWVAQLAGQTRLTVDARDAASVVKQAWARVAQGRTD